MGTQNNQQGISWWIAILIAAGTVAVLSVKCGKSHGNTVRCETGTQNSQQGISLRKSILIVVVTVVVATAIVVFLVVLTAGIADGAISTESNIQWNELWDDVQRIVKFGPIWLLLLVLAFGGAFLEEAKDAALRHRRKGRVGGNLLHGLSHAWREKRSAGMFYRFWAWVVLAIAGVLLAFLLTSLSADRARDDMDDPKSQVVVMPPSGHLSRQNCVVSLRHIQLRSVSHLSS